MGVSVYTWLIAGAIALFVYLFVFSFAKTCRFLVRFLFRAAIGMGALGLFNMVAASYGFAVGLNAVTCGFCGLFGLPGYILLIGARLIC